MGKTVFQIIDWIESYTQQARAKGLMIGILGGVDSAVVSTLYARTGLPTLCLEMPIHQAENHISRTEEHIGFLKAHYPNVTNLRVDFTPILNQFVMQVPLTDKPAHEMASADIRARLRMMILYYFASLEGYTIVSIGNKIENFGIGFFTKYDDEGVDISPIADLIKGEVYKFGEYLQMSQSILRAKLSNGLFGDDRSGEDQLKATYDELEWTILQIG